METKDNVLNNGEDKLDVLFRMQKGLDSYIRE